MPRVLFIGNCHAQYFASALASLTDVEVRLVGDPFPGAGFRAAAAPSVSRAEGLQWLAEGPTSEASAIVHQVTPLTNLAKLDGFEDFNVILFPFIKFDAPFIAPDPDAGLAFGSEAFEDKLTIARRADRLFNEMNCYKAGWGDDEVDELEEMAKAHPILLANSHFSGQGMAWFARRICAAGLGDVIGEARVGQFVGGVSRDHGIGFKLWDLPPLMSPSHRITWWPLDSLPGLLDRLSSDPRALAQDLRRGLSLELNEREAHELWTAASGRIGLTGGRDFLSVAMALYRPRLYSRWARLTVQRLLKRGRRTGASMILMHRLRLDDSRELFIQISESVLADRPMQGLGKAVARLRSHASV